ncbi:MAG: single-stranded DNA-binding protein [Microbacterium ginsengisoli]|uniref:single-stranded DNA-binding protein n=1 Tax=Microbacterium TaxID=33882 RepID=UPI0006F54710|nr:MULTISPECIES: single-stranded DNA-binding protein [unclassified Microbacterium]MBN9197265.1 single-stranded DNA-binding protein [Microbacterium ginsengisoli]KQR92983.1 hypothetical protein ASG00_01715 [Microbacterium sp. Leaf351]KQS05644.1 hypothetical protein ASF93_01510 [Microbacterium sp. Leaf347]ODU77159.1 MAG: hypothetical protein ABT08_07405 [Microbacterium sp. SCN 71-21]OJU77193.1 MAG: hypothetical protein BGO15_06855 [Microbacterium sp. 71-23]
MSEHITVIGNVAGIPERRTVADGLTVTTLRVAATDRRYDRQRQAWIDGDTNWYTVSAFRALGDHAHGSLQKGDRVIVHGRLRLREWDNGTRKGVSPEIEADAIGHDLRWGTTSFVRDHVAAVVEGAPDDSESSWALPGDESAGAPSREPVGDNVATPF